MGDDEAAPTIKTHAAINFIAKPLDVTATESPALRKEVKNKYLTNCALLQVGDGSWVKAVGVRRAIRENNNAYMLAVGVEPGARGAHVLPPMKLVDIENGALSASIANQIILGADGGVFEHDKVQVEILQLVPDSAKHRIVEIEAKLLGPGGRSTGMQIPRMGVDAFFAKYKPVEVRKAPAVDEGANGEGEEEPFDFTPYTKLANALRIVEAFGPDATTMELPKSQARVILSEILGGKTIAETSDVAELAAEAEKQLKSEKASPAMSRLTAVHCAGVFDAASSEQKAKAIRQFVMPESVGDSSTPEGQEPPKGQPSAPSKRKGRATFELEEDDSDSDDSSDSDDDIETNTSKPKRQSVGGEASAGGKKRAAPPEFDDEAVVLGTGQLAGLAPPGMGSIEVAKVIFDDPTVRSVAMCTEVPTSIDESEIKRVVKRYNLAYVRLVEVIGESWRSRPGKNAKSKAQLEEWAEGIADKVARLRGGAGAGPGGGGGAASGISLGAGSTYKIPRKAAEADDESTMGSQKASEGLSGHKQAASVSPAVAERMHANAEIYQQACLLARSKRADASAADMISETPETCRSDLQCTGMSNALVDGPGETLLFRRTIPPVGHGFRRVVLREIETAIRGMANTDMTQEVVIDPDVVSKLAAGIQDGTATLADFASASRAALGSAAAKQGTQMALVEAWTWMAAAIEAFLKALGALRSDVAALDEISNKVNAPPGLARLSAADLADWIEKVLRVWKQALRDFRSHERPALTAMPSFKACIAAMARNLEFKSLKAALAPPEGSSSSKAPTQGTKREAQGGSAGGPAKSAKTQAKDKGGGYSNSKAGAGSTSAAESAWPERQHVLTSSKFQELRDAAKNKYAGTCTFFLVAKCSKGSACTHEHKRPADFERFLNEHKVNLDGSIKVSSQSQ